MKKPPSASVRPPNQTTQRVPTRSSKPGGRLRKGRGHRRRDADGVVRRGGLGLRSGGVCAVSAAVAGCSAATFGDEVASVCSSSCRRGERWRARPRLRSGRFDRVQSRAQHCCLIECLARDNERDNRNRQRKEVKHQASRRSARRPGLPRQISWPLSRSLPQPAAPTECDFRRQKFKHTGAVFQPGASCSTAAA